MKLLNLILPCLNGQEYHLLIGKPTADPKRFICLLRSVDNKQDSLWNVEFSDEEDKICLWPYDGADSEDLILELLKDHLKHAFDAD